MPPKLPAKRNIDVESPIPSKIPSLKASPALCPLFGTKPEAAIMQCLTPCSLFGGTAPQKLFISDLRMGTQRNSIIVGRVTQIGDVRSWNNGNSEGYILSFGLVDSTQEICVTAFNENASKFNELIQINNVIQIVGFKVKPTNPSFNHILGQEKELALDNSTILTPSTETVPDIDFQFKNITQLMEQAQGTNCDFVGIIYEEGGLMEGISKQGKPYAFRNLLVTDRTKSVFSIKIWGKIAIDFCLEEPVAVAIRHAKIDIYLGDVYLNVGANSLFWIRPEIEMAVSLIVWLKEAMVQNA